MRKLLILLVIPIFLFLSSFNVYAAHFPDEYGQYMTFKDLNLQENFVFCGTWNDQTNQTHVFAYCARDTSLEVFIRLMDYRLMYFMDIYNSFTGEYYEYLADYNEVPQNNIGWTQEDGELYIIVKFGTQYQSDKIQVKTFVVSQQSDDYDAGYNDGRQQGRQEGYNEGYNDGKEQGKQEGYNEGYNKGMTEGSGAWGLLFSTMLGTFGAVLGIEIFPELTIGMLVAVPLILGLLSFIIGIAKGGRKGE